MATSLNANLHHPSLSCGTKLYSGLKLQSPSTLQFISLNFGFYVVLLLAPLCIFFKQFSMNDDDCVVLTTCFQLEIVNQQGHRLEWCLSKLQKFPIEFLVKELGNGLIYGMHCTESELSSSDNI
ncbi:hypothetical protein GQ457_11G023230 [Hibiscus cannabinus]